VGCYVITWKNSDNDEVNGDRRGVEDVETGCVGEFSIVAVQSGYRRAGFLRRDRDVEVSGRYVFGREGGARSFVQAVKSFV